MRLKPRSLRNLAAATAGRVADTLDATQRLVYKGTEVVDYYRSRKERAAQDLATQAQITETAMLRRDARLRCERLVHVSESAVDWQPSTGRYIVRLRFSQSFGAVSPSQMSKLMQRFGLVEFGHDTVTIALTDSRLPDLATQQSLALHVCQLYGWGLLSFTPASNRSTAQQQVHNAHPSSSTGEGIDWIARSRW